MTQLREPAYGRETKLKKWEVNLCQ